MAATLGETLGKPGKYFSVSLEECGIIILRQNYNEIIIVDKHTAIHTG
ncbi:MAG: hypothetical protein FWH04_04580 [Oscillospiraceae bacterium]|nr:hypothetical protein [Oscillospiraceae bacterium]